MEQGKNLAEKLGNCIYHCYNCFNACLEEEDVKKMKECIKLDIDCANMCTATLGLVHKDGKFNKEVLILCKNICGACAEECSKHPMQHCQDCAEACKECAMACSNYLMENVNEGTC